MKCPKCNSKISRKISLSLYCSKCKSVISIRNKYTITILFLISCFFKYYFFKSYGLEDFLIAFGFIFLIVMSLENAYLPVKWGSVRVKKRKKVKNDYGRIMLFIVLSALILQFVL